MCNLSLADKAWLPTNSQADQGDVHSWKTRGRVALTLSRWALSRMALIRFPKSPTLSRWESSRTPEEQLWNSTCLRFVNSDRLRIIENKMVNWVHCDKCIVWVWEMHRISFLAWCVWVKKEERYRMEEKADSRGTILWHHDLLLHAPVLVFVHPGVVLLLLLQPPLLV